MATEGTGAIHARGLGQDGGGQGWKVSPSIRIEPGETRVLADIEGMGAIQQIWLTTANLRWRELILRIYWDDQEHAVGRSAARRFLLLRLGPVRAGHLARRSASIPAAPSTATGRCRSASARASRSRTAIPTTYGIIYYQINYTLTDVPEDAAYFHAQFRRTNPLPYKDDYTILDGVKGQGHYVGTYMAWGVNNTGWWGEGEIKFFMDGDSEFPTICGTGTEDYFCGAYNFDGGVVDDTMDSRYREFTTPYAGLPQVIRPDGIYRSQQRFGMYRWHITDPIRFDERPAGHHPGARLAHREEGPPLPAAAGRHRLGRLLVPDAARPRRSRRCRTATISRSSDCHGIAALPTISNASMRACSASSSAFSSAARSRAGATGGSSMSWGRSSTMSTSG